MKRRKHTSIRQTTLAIFAFLLLFAAVNPAIAAEETTLGDTKLETTELGNFKEQFDKWSYQNGAEFPGALGQFERLQLADPSVGVDGYVANLVGDFTTGGLYVAARRIFDPLDIKQLQLQVQTADSAYIRLRMVDSTGQVHQQKLPLAASSEYEDIVVDQFNAGVDYSYWGGANDGQWHAPAKEMIFILERRDLIDGKKAGQIQINNVTVFSPAPPLKLYQQQLGNIFIQGEQVGIDVLTSGDEVEWKAIDFNGAEVASGNVSPAADGTASIAVPVTTNGYYSLQVTSRQAGTLLGSNQTSFAILEPFDISGFADSPFGLSTHFGQTWNTDLVGLISKVGAKSIRDEIYWKEVETASKQYQFLAKHDAYMSAVEQYSINPFIIFSYGNALYDGGKKPNTDEGHQGFADYGKAIVDNYPTLVNAVEVYNEFNHGLGEGNNGRYYLPLLKATYEKVKAAHSSVTVVGPATAGVPIAWMEELFELGGLEYLDAVSIHPYRYPSSPETGMVTDLKNVQKIIKKYNNDQDKPIWISELGWPTHHTAEGVSEELQATYLAKSYVLALANGVEKYFWYDLMDDGILPTEREQNFGIIRNGASPYGKYTPKPSYVAYAAMARELSEATFVEKEATEANMNSYLFHDRAEELRVVWSSAPAIMTLKATAPITVTDMMGAKQSYTPDPSGTIYLSLSERPVYVRGEFAEVPADSQFTLTDGEAVIGEPVTMKLIVNNTAANSSPIDATLQVGDSSYPVQVDAGKTEEVTIILPPQQAAGVWPITAQLLVNNQVIGQLKAQLHIKQPFTLQAKHQWDEKKDAEFLQVIIHNQSAAAQALDRLEWNIGSVNGVEQLAKPIAGQAHSEILIPLSEFTSGQTYPFELKLYTEQGLALSYNNKLVIPKQSTILTVPKQTITMDNSFDQLKNLPAIDIGKDGNNLLSPYTGDGDLDGQAWLSWDKEHLYFSAIIEDNKFYQIATGEQMWEGDSIQFALAPGYPGERSERFEFGVALTPEGPQMYNWYANGKQLGMIDAKLVVERDETTKQTVYKLALPWDIVSPIDVADGLFSFSFLVNDNDGQGRKGYIEWGSGIGTAKNPALFKPIRLAGVKDDEPVVDNGSPSWPPYIPNVTPTETTEEETEEGEEAEIDEGAPGATEQEEELLFTDVHGHWAEEAIYKGTTLRLVTGYPNGSFQPNKEITRSEFTVLLMRALEEVKKAGKIDATDAAEKATASSANTFLDQADIGAWASEAIREAVQAGIITGYNDGTFRPQATITRMEMAVMLARAAQLPLPAPSKTSFGDDGQIAAWARPAILAVQEAKLMQGRSGNLFAPLATASRAESVVTLLRMVEQ